MKNDLTFITLVIISIALLSITFLTAHNNKMIEIDYAKKACKHYYEQTGINCTTGIICFDAIRAYNQLYNTSTLGYCDIPTESIKTRGEYIRDYEVFSMGDTTT